jgi:hypothetical protein
MARKKKIPLVSAVGSLVSPASAPHPAESRRIWKNHKYLGPSETTGWKRGQYYNQYGNYSYDSYGYSARYGSGSASSFWSSRFYNNDDWTYAGSKNQSQEFESILNTVSRSANIVENSIDGFERRMYCRWSDGSNINNLKDNYIYLSPDVVSEEHTKKQDWTKEQKTDVLVGEALSLAAIKVVATEKAEEWVERCKNTGAELARIDKYRAAVTAWAAKAKSAAESGETKFQLPSPEMDQPSKEEILHTVARANWLGSETIAAHSHVVHNFPGFQPYIASKIEYHTNSDTEKNLTESLNGGKTDARYANALMFWRLLHPDVPIEAPQKYDEAVSVALERLSQTSNSEERARASVQTATEFIDLFGTDPEYKDPGQMGASAGDLGERIVNGVNEELSENRSDAEITDTDQTDINDVKYELKHHKVVGEYTDAYRTMHRKLLSSINALRNRLRLRNEVESRSEHGLPTGRLYEGSIYKLGYYETIEDNRIFEEIEIKARKDVGVTFLVDESGSMRSDNNIDKARNLCITNYCALLPIDGVDVAVLGHAAQGSYHGGTTKGVVVHHYITPEHGVQPTMAAMASHAANNLDGYAIQAAVKETHKWFSKHPIRILIHISDGLPNGDGYGGQSALTHVRKVCLQARAQGITVIGMCVGNGFGPSQCETMYGAGNWANVQKMEEVPLMIGNLLTRVILAGARNLAI